MRGARAPIACLFAGFAIAGRVQTNSQVSAGLAISPGDTVLVSERWF
jgi:hypothetical protein